MEIQIKAKTVKNVYVLVVLQAINLPKLVHTIHQLILFNATAKKDTLVSGVTIAILTITVIRKKQVAHVKNANAMEIQMKMIQRVVISRMACVKNAYITLMANTARNASLVFTVMR